MNMEGESESEAKAPLLVAAATDAQTLSSSSRRLRLSRRNSVNSFRQDFVSRLPDKLRPGLDLESASLIDFSKTTPLTQVSLVGQSASPEVLQKMTYLVIRHPQVKRIDTVRAYTFGVLYFVEVDIELPEELPLKEAHAIGETLQMKIEKLPEVERAFVHLDYECQHKPEHSVLSRLPNRED